MHRFFIIHLILFFTPAVYAGSAENAIVDHVVYEVLGEIRSIDGSENNKNFPQAGIPVIPFSRMSFYDYGDGVASPAARKVNPREISNYFTQEYETQNYKGASDLLWLWGQFLDHDITLTDVNPKEHMPISVPKCDYYFDVSCTGTNEMFFTRSESVLVNGVREQVNRTTAYIDASMVYGADEERAKTLRTLDGSGQLVVDQKGHLPKNVWGIKNLPSEAPHFFVAGDIRANDHIGLMAMHNLFVREHNYWAQKIQKENSRLDGEEIYQRARAIVVAEVQNITFTEFLPMLIGKMAPSVESEYNENLKATIFSEFSTAAFRMGHTFVSGELNLENLKGDLFVVNLRDSFFNPHEFERAGIDSILLGFSKQMAQARDPMINEALQNFLMIFPHEGIFDLFSFNIQRGRDHGIPSYNELRKTMGLDPLRDFTQISTSRHFNNSLSQAYDSVDDIDPWLGLIAEKAVKNALLGETASLMIAEQFELLRDADRFWFTHAYDKQFVDAIKEQTLSKIILRNTEITKRHLAEDVFSVK